MTEFTDRLEKHIFILQSKLDDEKLSDGTKLYFVGLVLASINQIIEDELTNGDKSNAGS